MSSECQFGDAFVKGFVGELVCAIAEMVMVGSEDGLSELGLRIDSQIENGCSPGGVGSWFVTGLSSGGVGGWLVAGLLRNCGTESGPGGVKDQGKRR